MPFVVWNAQHDWSSFAFALVPRHDETAGGFSPARVGMLYLAQAAAYSPGIWAVALLCAARPRNELLAWTALPLLAFLTAFALFHDVEIHWVIGAFASLCAGEQSRLHQSDPDLWQDAAHRWEVAGEPYQVAYCCWRGASAISWDAAVSSCSAWASSRLPHSCAGSHGHRRCSSQLASSRAWG